MEILLKNNIGFKWKYKNNLSYKGFIDENKILSKKFSDFDVVEYFEDSLKNNNQYFSIVFETNERILAAVDHLRMYPLYYYFKNGEAYLSDDPNWIIENIQSNELNEISTAEFLMTGYVTGSDTLISDIKQLQAGEYLIFNKIERKLEVREYFEFKNNKKIEFNKNEFLKSIDNIHLIAFKRLIESLNGRTVVLPLSGGYDSRVIAFMLKRLGYDKVICFTYGKPGNWEAKVSKEIAKSLGYKWIFISYTNEKWKSWISSLESKEYFNMVDGLTSLAHIQDHLAVGELKKRELIPTDSIFIPGHTAFLSFTGFDQNARSIEQVATSLFYKHYSLWKWSNRNTKKFKNQLNVKLINQLKIQNSNEESLENLFFQWEVKERHSKFICNSVRAYEFYGYEWRLPLWEKEMVEFWLNIPQEYRNGKLFYKEYFNKQFMSEGNELAPPNTKIKSKTLNFLKDFIKKNKWIFNILVRFQRIGEYYKHPLNWYNIISYGQYLKGALRGSQSINSYVVEIHLKYIKDRYKKEQ